MKTFSDYLIKKDLNEGWLHNTVAAAGIGLSALGGGTAQSAPLAVPPPTVNYAAAPEDKEEIPFTVTVIWDDSRDTEFVGRSINQQINKNLTELRKQLESSGIDPRSAILVDLLDESDTSVVKAWKINPNLWKRYITRQKTVNSNKHAEFRINLRFKLQYR